MHAAPRIIVTVLIGVALPAPIVSSATKPHSISTSRQFLVHASDVRLRGAICEVAEKLKAHLLKLLQLRDEWKIPLIVSLEYPRADAPGAPSSSIQLSQLGYGLKLQLNLIVANGFDVYELQRELMRAILIEMMYRARRDIPVGTRYTTPPDWLLDGILGLQSESDWDGSAQLLRTFLTQNRIASLEDIIGQQCDQLDAPSRKIHRVYSQALLQLLLEAPGGSKELARYIRDLPDAPNDKLADLRVHFPETLRRSPEKWWALAVAKLSAADRCQLWSARVTASKLDRLLRFNVRATNGAISEYSLGQYDQFLRLPAHQAALEYLARQLRFLGMRCHPLYQPIVQEEYALIILLLHERTRGLPERLNRLTSYRASVDRQAQAIDDYLNWYEATQFKSMSGAFDQILNAWPADQRSRRHDPISVYLDSMEMEMNSN